MTTISSYRWVAIAIALLSVNAAAQSTRPIDVDKARVVQHWTPERRAAAIPRDLVIDMRGLGYLRRPDGTLQPYGHDIAAQEPTRGQTPSPFAKPGSGTSDTTPPAISNLDPATNATIGASYTFKATVSDAGGSGVRSVTFKIQKVGSAMVNSFSATTSGGDLWSVSLQGFTDGDWKWWVEAKDKARNVTSTATTPVAFKVSTSGGGSGGGGDTITNAQWTAGGDVQKAAGRLYFEMPSNTKWTQWTGYVCSGTVATDSTDLRSVIITAAHCVYDDVNKAFARNVMFIPNQSGTTGSGTDLNCSNDPIGCWMPSFGVVDVNWTTKTFPDNIAWDYAFYVVKDSGVHAQGLNSTSSDALDLAAKSLTVQFTAVNVDDGTAGATTLDFTHALGYSYSDDPKFMYCAEDMTVKGAANWWLPSCGLSGGSSGGPWVQPMNKSTGIGPIISVNSWGYTNSPGMAGPKLVGTTASCVFGNAKTTSFTAVPTALGQAGVKVDPSTCPSP